MKKLTIVKAKNGKIDLPTAIEKLKRAARRSKDLLTSGQRKLLVPSSHYLQGFCYYFAEILCDQFRGLHIRRIKWEGRSHWYLVANDGTVIDPTVKQFTKKPPYTLGLQGSFLTGGPCKAAQSLAERAGIKLNHQPMKFYEDRATTPDGSRGNMSVQG